MESGTNAVHTPAFSTHSGTSKAHIVTVMRNRHPPSLGQRLLSACLLATGCGCAGFNLAEEPPASAIESLRVSGFGTVGITRT